MIPLLAGGMLALVPSFANLSLSDAMTRALSNSAAVASAHATVREREAELRLARIGGVPHVTADYSLSPQAASTGTATVEQHFVTVGAGISLNDVFAASARTREAAAELVAAQRDADASVARARTTAIGLYFSALQAVAVAGLRDEAVRGAHRELEAARIRAREGEAPRLDVLRGEVVLAQGQADLARASADRANAVDALASATNVATSALGSLGYAVEFPSPPLDEDRAVARALASRPELSALLASLDARAADVALARQFGWPTLSFGAGYQRGVDTAVPVQGPQAAVHLDLPVASGTNDRVTVVQAQTDAVRAQLAEERRTIALDVAAAVRTARAARIAQSAAERARDQAQNALRAVELGYREGASSSLDVDVSRRTFVQASVDALVAKYQRAQALALLEALVP